MKVTKQQYAKLTQIRESLNKAKEMFNELPDELQEEILSNEDGDGLNTCINRAAELAQQLTETVEIETNQNS